MKKFPLWENIMKTKLSPLHDIGLSPPTEKELQIIESFLGDDCSTFFCEECSYQQYNKKTGVYECGLSKIPQNFLQEILSDKKLQKIKGILR